MNGETVYVNGTEPVENVLVSASIINQGTYSASEITKPVGPIADYTLYFPMDYTRDLTGQRITVRGYDCAVIGQPDHERPLQVFGNWFGQWDMTVHVKRTLAAYAETITITWQSYTRNALGDKVLGELRTLYSGPAQVRWKAGGEETTNFATVAHTTCQFVLPWLDALNDKAPQQLTIQYGGDTYNVKYVENIDERDETASIEAVRRDD